MPCLCPEERQPFLPAAGFLSWRDLGNLLKVRCRKGDPEKDGTRPRAHSRGVAKWGQGLRNLTALARV